MNIRKIGYPCACCFAEIRAENVNKSAMKITSCGGVMRGEAAAAGSTSRTGREAGAM